MKTVLKLFVLPTMLLAFALVNQASADTLGNTIARKLCYNSHTNTYRLTSTEALQWGVSVSGAYSTTSNGVTNAVYFYKDAGQDGKATCKTAVKTSSGTTCSKWDVTKSGLVLTKATSAYQCN